MNIHFDLVWTIINSPKILELKSAHFVVGGNFIHYTDNQLIIVR